MLAEKHLILWIIEPNINNENYFPFFPPQAELIKGNSPSIGLTLRQIQAKEGETGHVVIETVTPNSAAATADLQRGDRLLSIGGMQWNYMN